ncbi:hypothetical protein ABZP36_014615 [Zizania latifolia]
MKSLANPPSPGSLVSVMVQSASDHRFVTASVAEGTGHVLGTTPALGEMATDPLEAGAMMAPPVGVAVETKLLRVERGSPLAGPAIGKGRTVRASAIPEASVDLRVSTVAPGGAEHHSSATVITKPTPTGPQHQKEERRLVAKLAMDSVQRAQTHLMQKTGILQPKEQPSDQSFIKYLELFKEPLTAAMMDAIISLTELSI